MGHYHEHRIVRRGTNDERLIASILLLCLLSAAGYALQHTISCFLLSWVIAYLLDPVLVRLEERGMIRLYALGLIYAVLAILTIFVLGFMLPKLTMSWQALIKEFPVYVQKIQQVATQWKERLPDSYGTEEIQWLLDKVSANLDTAAEKAGSWLYSFATRMFFNLFNIVLSPILVFFMLYYKQIIITTVASWLPKNRSGIILEIGREVNSSIGGYLRGQVVVSLIVAILSSLALFYLNVPHPFLCGIFAGAASVLPFIGVLIATLPALFFAWFKYQTVSVLAQVGIIFCVVYFLEGYVVKPLVFKKSMNLNPLVTIIMVMALGELIGFWGILLALPIAAALKIAWGHLISGDFKR
jgi:putative permease